MILQYILQYIIYYYFIFIINVFLIQVTIGQALLLFIYYLEKNELTKKILYILIYGTL